MTYLGLDLELRLSTRPRSAVPRQELVMAAVRDYPLNLPPPYLRFHNAPASISPQPSGRAPLVSPDGDDDISTAIDSRARGAVHIPRMPTADELAVSPIPESFRCPLCLDILDQPVTTIPCGHTFCEGCILRSMEDNGELSPPRQLPSPGGTVPSVNPDSLLSTLCPVCRGRVRKDCLGPCWIVRDLIGNILIRCDYGVSYNYATKAYEAGIQGACTATFRLSDRVLHLQECGHVMVPCQFACDGCDVMARRGHIRTHETECVYRSQKCACGERVLCQFLEDHQLLCPSIVVDCPHSTYGCVHSFPRGSLDEHLMQCPYEAVKDLIGAKDAEIQRLLSENLRLESSLWSAHKARQQLEQKVAQLQLLLHEEQAHAQHQQQQQQQQQQHPRVKLSPRTRSATRTQHSRFPSAGTSGATAAGGGGRGGGEAPPAPGGASGSVGVGQGEGKGEKGKDVGSEGEAVAGDDEMSPRTRRSCRSAPPELLSFSEAETELAELFNLSPRLHPPHPAYTPQLKPAWTALHPHQQQQQRQSQAPQLQQQQQQQQQQQVASALHSEAAGSGVSAASRGGQQQQQQQQQGRGGGGAPQVPKPRLARTTSTSPRRKLAPPRSASLRDSIPAATLEDVAHSFGPSPSFGPFSAVGPSPALRPSPSLGPARRSSSLRDKAGTLEAVVQAFGSAQSHSRSEGPSPTKLGTLRVDRLAAASGPGFGGEDCLDASISFGQEHFDFFMTMKGTVEQKEGTEGAELCAEGRSLSSSSASGGQALSESASCSALPPSSPTLPGSERWTGGALSPTQSGVERGGGAGERAPGKYKLGMGMARIDLGSMAASHSSSGSSVVVRGSDEAQGHSSNGVSEHEGLWSPGPPSSSSRGDASPGSFSPSPTASPSSAVGPSSSYSALLDPSWPKPSTPSTSLRSAPTAVSPSSTASPSSAAGASSTSSAALEPAWPRVSRSASAAAERRASRLAGAAKQSQQGQHPKLAQLRVLLLSEDEKLQDEQSS